MTDTYKFEGDTISLEGWSILFDRRRYRGVFLDGNIHKIFWMCEGDEELEKFNEFKNFCSMILDRQFETYLKEQQG